MSIGLGSDYPYSQYAMQFAIPRVPLGGNAYPSVRFREAGSWGSWSKIYAGYADTVPASGVTGLSSMVWTLSGSSIGSNDFLGTTNTQPLVVKTNNTERMRFLSAVSSTGALVFINGGDAVINGITV